MSETKKEDRMATSSSFVDGTKGILIYRGYDIRDLGANATFEEVIYLLWNGDLPNAGELESFKAALESKRALPDQLLSIMKQFPANSHPMAVLRTTVSALGLLDRDADDLTPEGVRGKVLYLTAIMPTIVAAWERIRNGSEPIPPRRGLSQAANFLYMLDGNEPNPDAVKALDSYLVLLADHGFNASTFSARVTTSTGTDVYSAITSAIGTLKGPAHGGATQRAMEQFIDAAQRGDVSAWFTEARESGRRIMGIGHRIYKVEDPRARILRPLAEKLAKSSGTSEWFNIAQQIEALARADDYFIERDLYANVDYYSAVVLYTIGLPVDQFTCLFTMSRIAGWCSQVMEQLADNRLIRPQESYVGQRDRVYVPLEKR
ncbi:MAG: citrate/2-methylcitrate synthase [Candidatus Promineofilum sp.]|nr:citrate/2-methylcitrate synthase [Promineifilum sp.]